MNVIGHRGACGYEIENSLQSLIRAVEMGADGIEFDVRLTKDRVPILIHDDTLDRTTPQSGRVADITFPDLRAVCDWNAVPSLEEALQTISSAMGASKASEELLVNVELKENAAVEPTRQVLLHAVENSTLRSQQILVTSFDHDALTRYRAISQGDSTRFNVGVLTKGLPDEAYWQTAAELEAVSANIDLNSVDANFVATAHARSLLVMVYTVNSVDDANQMRELGVDAIFSDFPDRVAQTS